MCVRITSLNDNIDHSNDNIFAWHLFLELCHIQNVTCLEDAEDKNDCPPWC